MPYYDDMAHNNVIITVHADLVLQSVAVAVLHAAFVPLLCSAAGWAKGGWKFDWLHSDWGGTNGNKFSDIFQNNLVQNIANYVLSKQRLCRRDAPSPKVKSSEKMQDAC